MKMKTNDLAKELIDKYKKKQSEYDKTKIFKNQRIITAKIYK
jgi:hypothetical protein